MTDRTDRAAALLRDVERWRPEHPGVMVPDPNGVWVDHRHVLAALLRDAIISGMRIATETPIEQVPAAIADVLAALSRALDPALAERAGEVLGEAGLLASTCERSGQHKRAETIRAAVMAGTDLLTANAALRAERDEADRRAGAAERELADKRDTISKVSQARDEMKKQRGYDYTVSFDRVWKETCEKADRAEAAEVERDKQAKAHEKEIYVWSENYAALERKLTAAEAREERLRGALGQLRKNATGQWVPSSVVTAIIDAALTETATTEKRK